MHPEATREEAATATEDGPSAAPWGRRELVQVLLLLVLNLGHWIPRLRGPIDLRFDAGVYYVLGTSLAQGKGYRLLNEPGEIQAIQYPPLLPAAVALHQLVLGTDDPLVVGQALRCSSLLLTLVFAFATYALTRRLVGAWPGLLAALLASLYFQTLYLEDLLFTEVPYGLLTVAFFLALGARRARLRACAPPLAAAAFFLRAQGVALFAAYALEAGLRRRWKAFAGRALLGLACVLAWQGYVWRVHSGAEYMHPAYEYQRAPYQFYNVSYAENVGLKDPFVPEAGRVTPGILLERVLDSAGQMMITLGESVSTTRGFWEWPMWAVSERIGYWLPALPITVLVVLLGLGVLLGLVLLARRGQSLLALYVVSSLGLIALLPWPGQTLRYLVPLTPFLSTSLVSSLVLLRRYSRAATASLCTLILVAQGFAIRQMLSVYHKPLSFPNGAEPAVRGSLFVFDDKEEWRAFYAALGWLGQNTEASAIVASACPHLVWLHTGRKAVMPPFEISVDEAQRLLDGVPVDYVVVDGLAFVDVSKRYASPVMEAHPELWEPVYHEADGPLTIYRRRR